MLTTRRTSFDAGEIVRIEECAPISKLKTWTVVDRIGAAKAGAVEIAEPELVAPIEPSRTGEAGRRQGREEACRQEVDEEGQGQRRRRSGRLRRDLREVRVEP